MPLIRITSEHVADLRAQGLPACLTWNENTRQVEVTDPWETACPGRMIICGHHDLAELSSDFDGKTGPTSDEDLAGALTDTAANWQIDWPGVRAMNLQVHELRRNLAEVGVYLSTAPLLTMTAAGLPSMQDHYCLVDNGRNAHVRVTVGFLEPTRITAGGSDPDAEPLIDQTLVASNALPHTVNSRLVAATVLQILHQGH